MKLLERDTYKSFGHMQIIAIFTQISTKQKPHISIFFSLFFELCVKWSQYAFLCIIGRSQVKVNYATSTERGFDVYCIILSLKKIKIKIETDTLMLPQY